jgi:hypothetical protein
MLGHYQILAMLLPELLNRINKTGEPGARCKSTLESVLRILEECSDTGSGEDREVASNFEFPGLERIREQLASPREPTHIIPYTKSSMEDILERFDIWTKRLERMIKSDPPTTRSAQEKATMPSQAVRDAAMTFKRATDSSWKCLCTRAHDIMLFLQTHRHIKESDNFIAFDVLFGTQGDSSHKWQDGTIYVMLAENSHTAVQFEFPNESPRKAPPARNAISELCGHLKSASPAISIDLRLEDPTFYRTRPSPSKLVSREAPPSQSLQDVINGVPILNARSRIKLAVLVAYSVLHLSGTHWLPPGWNKSSFYLLKPKDKSSFILRPLLGSRIGSSSRLSGYIPSPIHPHPDLLQLGILLLEIILKEPIERMKNPEVDDSTVQVEADRNLFAAEWKYDDYEWDVHEEYKAAVEACLRWDSPVKGPDQNEKEYSHYIYNNVVRPLERELEVLCKFGIDQLDEIIRENSRFGSVAGKTKDPQQSSKSISTTISLEAPLSGTLREHASRKRMSAPHIQPRVFSLFDDHDTSSFEKIKL